LGNPFPIPPIIRENRQATTVVHPTVGATSLIGDNFSKLLDNAMLDVKFPRLSPWRQARMVLAVPLGTKPETGKA
jgi:hypothetical protein